MSVGEEEWYYDGKFFVECDCESVRENIISLKTLPLAPLKFKGNDVYLVDGVPMVFEKDNLCPLELRSEMLTKENIETDFDYELLIALDDFAVFLTERESEFLFYDSPLKEKSCTIWQCKVWEFQNDEMTEELAVIDDSFKLVGLSNHAW